MKYLIYMGHPAHFHLFKNVIKAFEKNGHNVFILIKQKDILENLLKNSGMVYQNILPEGRKDSKAGIALGVVKRDWRLFRYCLKNRPDVLLGTSTEIGHVGTLLNIPSINFNEDDAFVVPWYSKISYPWCTHILSPRTCDNGPWEKKSTKYESYHELAYLHPDNFRASEEIVRKYLDPDLSYFLMRFAKLGAHHDVGIRGISDELALKVIDLLRPYGRVFITSERPLSEKFEPYRMKIDPLEIHHVMAFSQVYIGDSQTMAAEAGVLGVPFVRYNDFVGRIGYLNELENKYRLGYGIKPGNLNELFSTIERLVNTKNLKGIFAKRRMKMLQDKIDVARFMTWFIENYPDSVNLMRKDPAYQYRFQGKHEVQV